MYRGTLTRYLRSVLNFCRNDCFGLALVGLTQVDETFTRDLDYEGGVAPAILWEAVCHGCLRSVPGSRWGIRPDAIDSGSSLTDNDAPDSWPDRHGIVTSWKLIQIRVERLAHVQTDERGPLLSRRSRKIRAVLGPRPPHNERGIAPDRYGVPLRRPDVDEAEAMCLRRIDDERW